MHPGDHFPLLFAQALRRVVGCRPVGQKMSGCERLSEPTSGSSCLLTVPASSWHCRKAPAKAPAGGQNNADFRARRLSVAGVEEALPVAPAKKGGGTPTAGGRRARRMSMRCARGTQPAMAPPAAPQSPTLAHTFCCAWQPRNGRDQAEGVAALHRRVCRHLLLPRR